MYYKARCEQQKCGYSMTISERVKTLARSTILASHSAHSSPVRDVDRTVVDVEEMRG